MSESCEHDWSYAPYILASYPSQHPRICRKCGLKDVLRGECFEENDYEKIKNEFPREIK